MLLDEAPIKDGGWTWRVHSGCLRWWKRCWFYQDGDFCPKNNKNGIFYCNHCNLMEIMRKNLLCWWCHWDDANDIQGPILSVTIEVLIIKQMGILDHV
jgi:hypothetical protein